MKEYDFKKQLDKGEKYEKELDIHFSTMFNIKNMSMQAQKHGIDRIWTHINSGYVYSVEYKADETGTSTGNIFVETMSVDTSKKLGWGYTSCAQLLVYYLPIENIAYRITMLTLKHRLKEWIKIYEKRTIPNIGYNTEGILVPRDEFIKYCWTHRDIRGTNG